MKRPIYALLGVVLFPLAIYCRLRLTAESEAWRRTRRPPRLSDRLRAEGVIPIETGTEFDRWAA